MKTILVVNDSTPLRAFLEKQLSEYGFNVIQAIDGLDGWTKIRRDEPDLIIMDYFLSRKSSTEILKSIEKDPNIDDIPVVMTISKLEKQQIIAIAKYVYKKDTRQTRAYRFPSLGHRGTSGCFHPVRTPPRVFSMPI